MKIPSILLAIALGALATGTLSANDLTDYLPLYNLEHTQLVPQGTRSFTDDNREFDDYLAEYVYDENGHLTGLYFAGYMAGWGSAENFNWDRNGRLLSSTAEEHGSDVSFNHYETTYTSDANGRVVGYKKVRRFSAPPDVERVPLNVTQCTYVYDANGNCTTVTIADDGTTYDFGRNAVVSDTPTTTQIRYSYDQAGNLTEAVETVDGKERSRQTFQYADGPQGEYTLGRSIYTRPFNEEDGTTCTITMRYIPFGVDLPSGYVKKSTYKITGEEGEIPATIQTRIYNGVPLSQSEQ